MCLAFYLIPKHIFVCFLFCTLKMFCFFSPTIIVRFRFCFLLFLHPSIDMRNLLNMTSSIHSPAWEILVSRVSVNENEKSSCFVLSCCWKSKKKFIYFSLLILTNSVQSILLFHTYIKTFFSRFVWNVIIKKKTI